MFKIPLEASASINGLKPDGNGFRYDCSIENNKVVVDMKEQMTVLAGCVKCEILLSKGGERIATANFMLSVEESPLSENTPISSTDIPLLQKAIEASEIVLSVEKTVKGYSESASKSSQDGTPSVENPVEIRSIVNPTIKVCGKNLLPSNLMYGDRAKINIKKGVKLTIICKDGLVSIGGNLRFENADEGVTWFGFDAGNAKQQITLYNDAVAVDYLIPERLSENYALYIGDGNTYEPYKEQSIQLPITLKAIPVSSGGNVTIDGQQYIADYVDVEHGKVVRVVDSSKLDNTQSIIDKTEWLLAEKQETDLTVEQTQALKKLVTYYPVTHITVGSEQLYGYTVFNYPISLVNGWNYVKQQLNDNRDYIYDMDLQSAEAYVNSEYAVTLTELEV